MSEKRDDGGTAFPMIPPDTHNYREWEPEVGMSLRDFFAAKAMQALIARYGAEGYDECARISYEFSDAMLKERAK